MSSPARDADSRLLWALALAVLALAVWVTSRGWHAPILDRHEFRQVQTALSAYWIREEGYRLDYETPLFGPPWSIPMEFPVYQVLVGKLSGWLGVGLEPTGRAVSLFFLLASLPAVAGLAGLLGLSRSRQLLVAAAVLSGPLYLFYGRTLMIETTALCFSLWFLLAIARTARDARAPWAALAAGAGTLAALTKITTFIVHLPPAALLAWWSWRASPHRRSMRAPVLTALPVALAGAIGVLWVRHADVVKHTNPFSGFLTSTELAKWNWGTLEQRFSPEFWIEFWRNLSAFVLAEIALVPLLVGLVLARGTLRLTALAAAGSFLGATLLFSNLFYYHDYYYSANAALLLLGAGLLLVAIWDDVRLPRAVRLTLIATFFGGQFLIYHRGYADYLRRAPTEPPGIAAVLHATTPPDGVVLIYGWDWNGILPYHAQRRAIMVPNGREDDIRVLEDLLAQLPPRRIAALVVNSDALRQSPSFVGWRTNRLKLSPTPIASSPEGDVYLAEDLAALPPAALADRTFAGVTLHLETTEPAFPATQLVAPAAVALPIFSPAPLTARTQHGMNAGDVDGRPALHAHAPCELEFTPPAGARHISASYGLLDAAWNAGPARTDGIGVEIFERLPSGQRRALLRRELDPARRPEDRGRQTLDLRDAGPFHGVLVFRFTTGAHDNVTNDWAYWTGIEIR